MTADMLSKEAYGEGLAEWLWDELGSLPAGGGILEDHRDDCGVGLIQTADGVGLYRVDDGRPWPEPLVVWRDRESFVSYWSAQSDHGLSGADSAHPEVGATHERELNHQPINRRRIYEFLEERQRIRDSAGGGQRRRRTIGISFSGIIQGNWPPRQ